MKSRLLYPTALAALLSLVLIAAAPGPQYHYEGAQSFFDRIARPATTTDITLMMDVDGLLANKYSAEDFPATIRSGGENFPVEVSVRGRYRRRVCDFPPLKLKFNKDMLEAAGLERHSKFKLVTHCSDSFDSDDNLLREKMAYDLYALLTGEGYRTQLVNITYIDDDSDYQIQRLGIIIEDTDEMAEHLGGEECDECFGLQPEQFIPGNLEAFTLFQYLIGNTDWSVNLQRNLKIVTMPNGAYKAVPYDFDFAGLVNAEYAVPNPDLDQQEVKDRVWQGQFGASEQLDATASQILAQQETVMAFVDQYPGMSNRSKRQIKQYLASGFEAIATGEVASAL
ncbi:MAG: hypothetical protein KDC54_19150 [Lewinella sp.]|nr:hypothetical protein [Lewinella sp.]